MVLHTSLADECSADSISLMSTIGNVVVGASGVMRYLPLYILDVYITWYIPRLDAPGLQ